ncbi:uncharacterized protein LOC134353705 isoform X2 [Mobula hypostoma]|uniref:uncharacterized protein LOC134353705 isoform X2 n=1 Tax=Mobula hypostoma TaxID=723540 RepID=UPI002FC39574
MAAKLGFSSSRAWARSRRYRWSGASGPLVLFLIVVWFTPAAESLDMTIFRSPNNVLLNTDITLECKVTDFGTPLLDLSNVGVKWLYGSQRKEIYIFNAGDAMAKRHGAKIFETELRKGDASLYLPNIQLNEAGEYICVVLVTPDRVEKSSQIVVLAKPKVLLSTQHITILNGTEKSVWCDATEFYPQKHEIFWEKRSRGKTERLERHVCTGAAVSNNDGTFNVSSNIRIEPTLNDDGNVYKCTVRHQSLPDELSQKVKLTVEVSEPESASTAAVGAAFVGGFVLCFPFAAGLLACWWRFRAVPPKITGCSEYQVLKHLEESVVTWMVSSFRPYEITIVIYAKRKQNDKCQLLNWSNKDGKINCCQYISTNGPDCNETKILIQSDDKDASFRPQISEFKINTRKICSVEVSVGIYPDISQDDGAELSIQVQHQALKEPITKTLTLDVKGVPPKVLNILTPPLIKDKEPVALSCSVSGFKPRPLSIIWQQKRKNKDLEELGRLQLDNTTIIRDDKRMNLKAKHHISEVEHEDKTYSIVSVLVIVPNIQQDQNSQYLCSILHHSTNDKQEKEITLRITVSLPKISEIKADPPCPEIGKPLKLSCTAYGFYPEGNQIFWFKDDSKIEDASQAGIVTEESTVDSSGLYSRSSHWTFNPTARDHGKEFKMQFLHSETSSKSVTSSYCLQLRVSLPKISEIKADPPCPEIGKPVTLSCTAYGFFPEGNHIFWFKDNNKIQDASQAGIVTEESTVDSSGFYSRSAHWTFKPTARDHGKEFKMQFLHSETSTKPVTSSYCLQLRVSLPKISEIKADPPCPEIGKPVTLSCTAYGFFPEGNHIFWFKDNNKIQDASQAGIVTEESTVDSSGFYSRSAHWTFKPTARDHGKEFKMQFLHSETSTKPVTSSYCLQLRVSLPKISEIKADPPCPEIGKPVTLSCTAYGFFPEGNHIFWFKDNNKIQDASQAGIVTEESTVDSSGFYSRSAHWTFKPTARDHGKEFKMQFLHSETSTKPVTSSYCLQLRVSLPKISEIKADPPCPEIGKPVTLSCTAYGFFPEGNHIFWFKDNNKIQDASQAGIVTEESTVDSSGFYSRSAHWTFKPTARDHGKEFKMQFLHSETSTKPVTSSYCLQLRVSLPKISEIKADPPCPEIGKPVTLSCTAYGFFPEGNHIFWFKDNNKIQDASQAGIVTEESTVDSSGFYSRSSHWTFNPTARDHGKEFKMQILHSETSSKSVTSSYCLQLRDHTSKKDGSSKEKEEDSDSARTEGSRSSSFSKDHTSKKDGSSKEKKEDSDSARTKGSRSSSFSKDVWQKVSEIKCPTKSPKIGQPVTLSCDVKGCALEEARIFWYRHAYPFVKRSLLQTSHFKMLAVSPLS